MGTSIIGRDFERVFDKELTVTHRHFFFIICKVLFLTLVVNIQWIFIYLVEFKNHIIELKLHVVKINKRIHVNKMFVPNCTIRMIFDFKKFIYTNNKHM